MYLGIVNTTLSACFAPSNILFFILLILIGTFCYLFGYKKKLQATLYLNVTLKFCNFIE